MLNFIKTLLESLDGGTDVALVSIVAESGSTPRGVGAKMMVRTSGGSVGTIGGGAVEFEAEKLAKKALAEKTTFTHEFSLTKNGISSIGMICGGNVTVLVQYLCAQNENTKAAFRQALGCIKQNTPCALVTALDEPGGDLYLVQPGQKGQSPIGFEEADLSKARLVETGGHRYLVEPLSEGGRALIFGMGHVGAQLVPVLYRLGFYLVAMDDREEFLQPERIPLAHERRTIDFTDVMDGLSVTGNDYIVILTRGHQYDFEVLRQALRTDARYIGMIGSKSKVGATNNRLREEGFTDAEIARAHSPIGIPLGGGTPEEIAISIAAEMIRERSGYKGGK